MSGLRADYDGGVYELFQKILVSENNSPPHPFMSLKTQFSPPSLPYQVLLASLLGILIGWFLGEKAAFFEPIGTIYSRLLEVVAIPYIICTLLTSFGNLTPALSKRLLKKSWIIYLFLLTLVFLVLILLGQAIPLNVNLVSELSTNELNTIFIKLLVPSNFFKALTDNYIPSIILFCVLFGLALQHIPEKNSFMNVLETISSASLIFLKKLVNFAPLAAFALCANIIGVTTLSQLMDISEFLILFLIGSFLLIFWILPIVISSCTGIAYRSILYEMRDALILSAVTTLPVVSLPFIRAMTSKFVEEKVKKEDREEKENIIKTIVMISYPFAQIGNFFVYIFILFAHYYFNHSIDHLKYYLLLPITYLSSIGSPSTSIDSVSFLSDWLALPKSAVTLYVGLTPLIRYAQVLVSVMGFTFISILCSFAVFHRLEINFKKIFLHLLIIFALLTSIVFLLISIFPSSEAKNDKRLNKIALSPSLINKPEMIIFPAFNEAEENTVKNIEDSLLPRLCTFFGSHG